MPGNESRIREASRTAFSDCRTRSSATSLRKALRSRSGTVALAAEALGSSDVVVELQLGQTPGAVQRDLETILQPLLRSDVIRSELEPERRKPGVSVAPILSSRDDEEQSDPTGTRDDDERSDPTAAPAPNTAGTTRIRRAQGVKLTNPAGESHHPASEPTSELTPSSERAIQRASERYRRKHAGNPYASGVGYGL